MQVYFSESDNEKDYEDEIIEKVTRISTIVAIVTGILSLIQGIAIAVLFSHMWKVQFMLDLMLR